ncbi:5-formyltetrahydrofolate cyclo-ligase [Anaerorhabdus furcosa]|uniref:5-formyltetrahydrofolate cyclo-ligase n=1 Tax=Anaerorhabdus furcosa TaxID=118967 RepID=A0A1T4NBF4_9FIRM|nr:5-formyltetrahydrofolate cyclo-ligase [Anaerorhabdus furcosa]SJZ76148.1 5-formyltetrahydrofolate cyclo-ligase [Anaerorhabdus furcosa]
MEKHTLREIALKKRSELTNEDRKEKSEIIAKEIKKECIDKQIIGIYVSKGDEVDTQNLIKEFLEEGKTIVVPKVVKKSLIFVEIKSFDDLEDGVFGLLEPISNEEFDLNKIEYMVVPMVAFDSLKHRIGYGKGYYDSILDKVSCPHIGIAYAMQQVENFICSAHDVAMDKIITEYSEF